jgi:hypothetical protein
LITAAPPVPRRVFTLFIGGGDCPGVEIGALLAAVDSLLVALGTRLSTPLGSVNTEPEDCRVDSGNGGDCVTMESSRPRVREPRETSCLADEPELLAEVLGEAFRRAADMVGNDYDSGLWRVMNE